MKISAYTFERADAINKMNIPEIEKPFGIKVLWFDNIKSDERVFYSELHSHSFFEIHFVFSGSMIMQCGDEKITVESGEALLLPPGVFHKIADCTGEFRSSLAFTLNKGELLSGLLAKGNYRKFCFGEEISRNVEYILEKAACADYIASYLISNRIFEIICHAAKSLGVTFLIGETEQIEPRVAVAEDFVRKNMHRIISCEDVAKECCLSRKQLSSCVSIRTRLKQVK